MSKIISIVVGGVLGIILSGCGGSGPKPISNPSAPSAKQATFIESTSASEVTVRATGRGKSLNEAIADSRLSAIWFVLYGGASPLLSTPNAQSAFGQVSKKYYLQVESYIVYESGIKSKKQGAGKYQISKIYRINVDKLESDLVQDEIIVDIETLSEAMNMPSIAVVFDEETTNKTAANTIGVDAISEYLQKSGFEVEVPKATQKVNKILSKAMAIGGTLDPIYLLALQTGADMYAVLNVDTTSRKSHNNTLRKAAVSIKVYYTATGKQLAVSTGYSAERVVSGDAVLIQEATNDASRNIIAQIKKSWIKESKNGKLYKIIATVSPELNGVDRSFYTMMKSSCNRVKKAHGSQLTFNYSANCKVDDATALFYMLEENYTGEGKLFKEMESGALLMIKVAQSESDEFEIE